MLLIDWAHLIIPKSSVEAVDLSQERPIIRATSKQKTVNELFLTHSRKHSYVQTNGVQTDSVQTDRTYPCDDGRRASIVCTR